MSKQRRNGFFRRQNFSGKAMVHCSPVGESFFGSGFFPHAFSRPMKSSLLPHPSPTPKGKRPIIGFPAYCGIGDFFSSEKKPVSVLPPLFPDEASPPSRVVSPSFSSVLFRRLTHSGFPAQQKSDQRRQNTWNFFFGELESKPQSIRKHISQITLDSPIPIFPPGDRVHLFFPQKRKV